MKGDRAPNQSGPPRAFGIEHADPIDTEQTWRIAIEVDEAGAVRFSVQQWGWITAEQLVALARASITAAAAYVDVAP